MEQQKMQPQTVVIVGKHKSAGIALLVTILFGPLGLLYASVAGGITMMILGAIVGVFTAGIGLLVVWPLCIIWSVAAVSMGNKKLTNSITKATH